MWCCQDTTMNKTVSAINSQSSWGTDIGMIKLKSVLSREVVLIYMSLTLSIYASSFGMCMCVLLNSGIMEHFIGNKIFVFWLVHIMNHIPNNFWHLWFRKPNSFQYPHFFNKAFVYICIVFSFPELYKVFPTLFFQCLGTFCRWHYRVEHCTYTWNGW